ncbi:MAG: M23 family metallopeptidase [Nocardioidaceae bacterium]|nr:M23 family metallopeptidase [Nocardioidaceae bacterium]
MGSHRAEPGANQESRSDDPVAKLYVGRRVAARPVDDSSTSGEIELPEQPAAAPVAPMAPAAEAGAPTRRSSSPSPTVEIPLLSAHHLRAATTGSLKPAVPGKRRAAAEAPARRSLVKRLPSAPILVGVATLAIAIGGAVASAHTSLASSDTALSAPNAMSGAFGSASVGSRTETISRDSDRQTLQGATNTRLVQEAEQSAQQRNSALGALALDAEKKAHQIAQNRWVLPITAGGYHLTARFGQCSGLWQACHTGLDFACPTGTPIHALADGVINFASWDGSYGNKTAETLADGTEIWYAHQNAFNVHVGEHVVQGQIIGYVGSTGNTTGPHVHIEVRPGGGDPVDPDPAFVQHGVNPDANQG